MDGGVISRRRAVPSLYQTNANMAPRTTTAPIAPPAIAPEFTDVVVVGVVVDILLVEAAPTVAGGGVALLLMVVVATGGFNVAEGTRNSLSDVSKAYSHDIGSTWRTLP